MVDDPAFPTLDDAQLAALDALGTRRSVAPGEFLYREGDATYGRPPRRSLDASGAGPCR